MQQKNIKSLNSVNKSFVRIGVDVGGTNTDAVIVSDNTVLASHKTLTTENVSSGIITAITDVLKAGDVPASAIQAVMIGTTHFINAILQRKNLQKVAAIRLCLPAASGLPPFIDWPADLVAALGGQYYLLKGGYEVDGREISPLDEKGLLKAIADIRQKNISSIAVSCVFSHVNCQMEKRAAEIIRNELPGADVSLSHHIGRLGLLERENSAILNASLTHLAREVEASLATVLENLDIKAPMFVCENDGTLMLKEHAMCYPVMTFASGASNSIRGAAFLAKKKNAVVADIGGTTTDIGILVDGFPHEAMTTIDIGQVRTNFSMPDLLSIALGGGSVVHVRPELDIGPDSLGRLLHQQGLAFGGSTMTLTDVAIAKQNLSIGDNSFIKNIDMKLVDDVIKRMHQYLDDSIEQVKFTRDLLPLVLVGGGSILISEKLDSVSEIIIPEYADVANAVGAAIGDISGVFEHIVDFEKIPREKALARAKNEAIKHAIKGGACADTVAIIEVQEIPLSYLPGKPVRVRVKAVGKLVI